MIKSIDSLRDGGSIVIESLIEGTEQTYFIDYSIQSKTKGKWFACKEYGKPSIFEQDPRIVAKIKSQLEEYQKEQNHLIDKALES